MSVGKGFDTAPSFIILLFLFFTSFTTASSVGDFGVVMAEISITSDWAVVRLEGLNAVGFDYQLIKGHEAPDFSLSVKPWEIAVSKRQFDETEVVVRVWWITRGVDKVVIRINKGAIGVVDISFYALSNGVFKPVGKISHYINKSDVSINPGRFVVDFGNYGSAGVPVHVEEVDLGRTVCAAYYAWYGNALGPSREWRHWEGVSATEIGSATHYPLLGPYDSNDVSVLKAHMLMAKAAGVDCFLASWWGIASFEDETLAKLLKVAEEVGVKVALLYESYRPWDNRMGDPQHVAKELYYVAERYPHSPAYLKINGRPAVFIYAAYAHGRGSGFWAEVKNALRARGVDLFIIGDAPDEAFDGYYSLILEAPDLYEHYSRLRYVLGGHIYGTVRQINLTEKAIFYTVFPGYNDTKIRKPGRVVDREGGRLYAMLWEKALEANPHGVVIMSWNEWHEGTEIEPSVEYGFQYLNATAKYAALFKGGGSVEGCRGAELRAYAEAVEHGLKLRLVNVGNCTALAVVTKVESPDVDFGQGIAGYLAWATGNAAVVHIPLVEPGQSAEIFFATSPLKDSVDVNVEAVYYTPALTATRLRQSFSFIALSIASPAPLLLNGTVLHAERGIKLWLPRGSLVNITAPLRVNLEGGEVFDFVKWSDGYVGNSRLIRLTTPMVLIAMYQKTETSTVTVTTFITTREVYTTTLTTTTTTTVTVTQSRYEYGWATAALIVAAIAVLLFAIRIARRATTGQPNH